MVTLGKLKTRAAEALTTDELINVARLALEVALAGAETPDEVMGLGREIPRDDVPRQQAVASKLEQLLVKNIPIR